VDGAVPVRFTQSGSKSTTKAPSSTQSIVEKMAPDTTCENESKWQPENVIEDLLDPWTRSVAEFSAITLSATVTVL
jgi:hypothetical protein